MSLVRILTIRIINADTLKTTSFVDKENFFGTDDSQFFAYLANTSPQRRRDSTSEYIPSRKFRLAQYELCGNMAPRSVHIKIGKPIGYIFCKYKAKRSS